MALCCCSMTIPTIVRSQPKPAASAMNACSPALLRGWTGHFVSSDGFYGDRRRVEYLEVKLDDGFLIATKLVGDSNVPRGKVSWKTLSSHPCASNQSKFPILIQARYDISDPNGYFWMDDNSYISIEDPNTLIVGVNCQQGCLAEGRLNRITKRQALDAASRMSDHE